MNKEDQEEKAREQAAEKEKAMRAEYLRKVAEERRRREEMLKKGVPAEPKVKTVTSTIDFN